MVQVFQTLWGQVFQTLLGQVFQTLWGPVFHALLGHLVHMVDSGPMEKTSKYLNVYLFISCHRGLKTQSDDGLVESYSY